MVEETDDLAGGGAGEAEEEVTMRVWRGDEAGVNSPST